MRGSVFAVGQFVQARQTIFRELVEKVQLAIPAATNGFVQGSTPDMCKVRFYLEQKCLFPNPRHPDRAISVEMCVRGNEIVEGMESCRHFEPDGTPVRRQENPGHCPRRVN
jgi:hypothetical protein